MTNISDIELHDAQIDSSTVDFVGRTITLGISYYATSNEKTRAEARLVFEGVQSISTIVSLEHLAKNRNAGNVNYWVPVSGSGTTYIYLVDGCIAVCAESLRVEKRKSD